MDTDPTASTAADGSMDGTAADDLAALREEVASLQDQLLRRAAEFQNYRRRSEADRTEADRRGRAAVLLPLVDVFDDLGRSLEAAQRATRPAPGTPRSPAVEALAQGVELVYRKFEAALAALDVARIETVGQPFDEAAHEAVMREPATPQAPAGTVVNEIQPGYRMGDRVLRHARVSVAD